MNTDKNIKKLITQFIPITITNLQREDCHYESSPKEKHPAFYGCYDWHSAVHSHWQLIRAVRLFPDATFQEGAVETLEHHLTAENITRELQFLRTQSDGYECPYGMAWCLQLAAELYEWEDSLSAKWEALIEPLVLYAREKIYHYLSTLETPNCSGLHRQTAFSLTLALDWARTVSDKGLITLIEQRSREFYQVDRDIRPISEPSYNDFLSPTLAEADLMRRIFTAKELNKWLNITLTAGFLSGLQPVEVVDRSDGQLSHWAGLNMSRAWMLEGVASALPNEEARRTAFMELAQAHFDEGRRTALAQEYAVSHWVPSFLLYYVTHRGIF